jgi:phosphate-selective porin
MALIAGTLAVGLAGGAFAQDADATTTSYDKGGLNFKTGKAFSLNMSTNLQIRAQLTDNRDVASGADAGDSMSFYVRRLKTSLKGNVFDSKWNYKMTFAWQDAATGNGLEDAEITYKGGETWAVGAGRRKSFFNLQEYTSSSKQQFVDRSIANEVFNNDFVTGVWYDGNMKAGEHTVRYNFGIYNGTTRTGNNFGEQRDFASGSGAAASNNGFRMMYAGRVELIGNGDTKAKVLDGESDLRSDSKERPLQFVTGLGASLMQLDDTETPNVGGARTHKADVWNLVWDARIHVEGFSVGAGLFHRTVNFGDTADTDVGHASGYTDMGAYAQLGYAIHTDGGIWEPAIRYSLVDRDDFNSAGRQQDDSELSVGVNYFMQEHKLKLTFDATYGEARVHGVNANPTRPTATYRLQLQMGF